jgi:pentatricopeptide repeat protein
MPDGFGVGAKSDRGEGAKSAGEEGAKSDTTIKNIQKEEDISPIVPKKGTKRESIKMPVDDDPAKALFLAYRAVVFTDAMLATHFMLGEWRGAHHVLRSMQAAGVTPEQVSIATNNLVKKWGGRKDMVTLNALWKHWSTAINNEKTDLVSSTISQVDRIWQD